MLFAVTPNVIPTASAQPTHTHHHRQLASAAAAAIAMPSIELPYADVVLSADVLSPSPSRLVKRQTEHSYRAEIKSLRRAWVNPCDGIYEEIPNKRHQKRKVLLELRSNIVKELSTLPVKGAPLAIDDIGEYVNEYRFMPQLNITAKLSLHRIQNHMKVNVAAMAQELRAQLKWEYLVDARNMPIGDELRGLLRIQRTILCDVEVTLNRTTTLKHRQRKLFKNTTITPKKIQQRLKTLTNRMQNIKVPGLAKVGEPRTEPSLIEQRFVKYHTLKYACNLIARLDVEVRRLGKRLNVNGQRRAGGAHRPPICGKLLRLKAPK